MDVLIVGAGSAGCVLAARLSENPARSVMLLEAGPDYRTEADLPSDIRSALAPTTSHDWGYANVATPTLPTMPLPRGKLVGGSSATNGAFALRGAPADYDEWVALGNEGWAFADVLPYFQRLEADADFHSDFHGQDGPLPIRRPSASELLPEQRAFLDACTADGFATVYDHNAPGAVGAGVLPMNAIGGVRQSTAMTYLAAARERPNLTVRANVQVDHVLMEGDSAQGVRLAGTGETILADRVVLAAGAYGSPAILMRSGIGPSDHLRMLGIPVHMDLPGVGANLRDHPRSRVRFSAAPRSSDVQGCQAVLTLRSAPERRDADLQVFPWSVSRDGTFVLNACLIKPLSTGSVHLRSRDPLDALVVDSGFFAHAADMPRMIHAVRTARRLAATPALAAYASSEIYPGQDVGDDADALERAIRADLKTYFHPVGTCRMGADLDAVVDARAHVRGIAQLFVVDASIMPTIPAANTNLPTIMVAERCAEWITE